MSSINLKKVSTEEFKALTDVLTSLSKICSDCTCKDGKIILRADKPNILVDIRFPFSVDFQLATLKVFAKLLKLLDGKAYGIGEDENYSYFASFDENDDVIDFLKFRNLSQTINEYGREKLDALLSQTKPVFKFKMKVDDLFKTENFIKAFNTFFAIISIENNQPKIIVKSEDKSDEVEIKPQCEILQANDEYKIALGIYPDVIFDWEGEIEITIYQIKDDVALVAFSGKYENKDNIHIPAEIYLQTVCKNDVDSLITEIEGIDFLRN